MSDHSFAVTERNRVKRLHERGSYDQAAVFAILDAALLCHVAYAINGQPYCTPTMFWREDDMLYWHGSSASRMLRHLKGGIPTCLTVSHLDGLVLARSGFHHSLNYRSAMCFGTAHIVDAPEAKARALAAVVDRLFPGRAATLRSNDPQEVKAVTVIGMRIEEASAKVRAKNVADDEEDYALPIWAGVVGIKTVIGEDDPCPRLKPGVARPDNLSAYAQGRVLDDVFLEMQRRYEQMQA
ncbi:MAG TPA: pyridoxamine 5'-phosphate oxidase family protein [Rhizomicrobium sp.]|nr:pyridoxamine 5'-phosphate oxidase family protein [Rhizomicrobium sp.]